MRMAEWKWTAWWAYICPYCRSALWTYTWWALGQLSSLCSQTNTLIHTVHVACESSSEGAWAVVLYSQPDAFTNTSHELHVYILFLQPRFGGDVPSMCTYQNAPPNETMPFYTGGSLAPPMTLPRYMHSQHVDMRQHGMSGILSQVVCGECLVTGGFCPARSSPFESEIIQRKLKGKPENLSLC